jgi:transcriptional regulator with XRE-family HTH domain
MDLREIFPSNLRRLRNANGLSQEDLAYDAKISRSCLSQLEKRLVLREHKKLLGNWRKRPAVEPEEFWKRPIKRRGR